MNQPFPAPLSGGHAVEINADVTYRKVKVHCRVAFELFDAAQQLLAELDAVEMLRDGGNMACGFNVFWVQQSAPGVLDITTADYRADAFVDRTGDLSEALWIHQSQAELAELVAAGPVATRFDHLIDITADARAALGDPGVRLLFWRANAPYRDEDNHPRSGWIIDLEGASSGGALEAISAAELAQANRALATVLALPADQVVLMVGAELRGLWRNVTFADVRSAGSIKGAAAAAPQVLSWQPPQPPPAPEPQLVEITHTSHGKALVATVDSRYEQEALDMLRSLDFVQPEEVVDNVALWFGVTFLVWRQDGDRLRMKATDFTVPGLETNTTDVTVPSRLRSQQANVYRQLGEQGWSPINGNAQIRVHPGALDGPRITMRRVTPTEPMDSGWVIGGPEGEPAVMKANEVYRQAPAVGQVLPTPVGFEVTLHGDAVERAVDGNGTVVYPR